MSIVLCINCEDLEEEDGLFCDDWCMANYFEKKLHEAMDEIKELKYKLEVKQ